MQRKFKKLREHKISNKNINYNYIVLKFNIKRGIFGDVFAFGAGIAAVSVFGAMVTKCTSLNSTEKSFLAVFNKYILK